MGADAARSGKAHDSIQTQIADYAFGLTYGDLPAEAVHAATGLIIDTLGVLVAGFGYEPCRAVRACKNHARQGCVRQRHHRAPA